MSIKILGVAKTGDKSNLNIVVLPSERLAKTKH